jgi:hypothetical protein
MSQYILSGGLVNPDTSKENNITLALKIYLPRIMKEQCMQLKEAGVRKIHLRHFVKLIVSPYTGRPYKSFASAPFTFAFKNLLRQRYIKISYVDNMVTIMCKTLHLWDTFHSGDGICIESHKKINSQATLKYLKYYFDKQETHYNEDHPELIFTGNSSLKDYLDKSR